MKNKFLILYITILSILALNSCNNEAITCKITSPKNEAEFWKKRDIVIPVTVSATTNRGSIIQVQVFIDDDVVGSLTEPPYNFTIPIDSLPARTHYLTAVAYSSSNQEVDAIFITIKE